MRHSDTDPDAKDLALHFRSPAKAGFRRWKGKPLERTDTDMSKKKESKQFLECPICGARYEGPPATSRIDDRTPICQDCGTRQALTRLGVCEEEQEKILEIIHRNER